MSASSQNAGESAPSESTRSPQAALQPSRLNRAPSLTSFLLDSAPQPFYMATQHPFLRHAGLGTLSKETLERWLSQDRLYAQSYIGFIGALIARVELPYSVADQSTSLRWRIVNLLSSALENILRELRFFNDTAEKYGLRLDASAGPEGPFTAEPATKQYIDLFRAFSTDPSMSLLEGLVVLWATEKCYLKAWTFASSFMEPSGAPAAHADKDGGALRNEFIPNWTSREFEKFVEDIAEVTDLLAEREDAINRSQDVYTAVWARLLDIEAKFWPSVEES
ncbi:hypothetical protein PV08_04804 [Exophiala spinifera]|uniref:Thiaminase-2/PQQC domain-containing protein n=1 Tax=Exophiala spinifera TaxID=91928 RepID=A0A0D2C1S9_9EURO|nr:uncharacterized protein PV08_04804 [Exophiala spinifera]KIW17609.1 hypothetical protein PV08_04804 [Exophiala spinifera]